MDHQQGFVVRVCDRWRSVEESCDHVVVAAGERLVC